MRGWSELPFLGGRTSLRMVGLPCWGVGRHSLGSNDGGTPPVVVSCLALAGRWRRVRGAAGRARRNVHRKVWCVFFVFHGWCHRVDSSAMGVGTTASPSLVRCSCAGRCAARACVVQGVDVVRLSTRFRGVALPATSCSAGARNALIPPQPSPPPPAHPLHPHTHTRTNTVAQLQACGATATLRYLVVSHLTPKRMKSLKAVLALLVAARGGGGGGLPQLEVHLSNPALQMLRAQMGASVGPRRTCRCCCCCFGRAGGRRDVAAAGGSGAAGVVVMGCREGEDGRQP